MAIAIGTRVRLTEAIDVYPLGIYPIGLTGTLVRVDDEEALWVRLDQHFPELSEWNNELQIWNYEDLPASACIEAITIDPTG